MSETRRTLMAAALIGLGTLGAVPGSTAEPVGYQIDPEHLSVGFLVDHIGYAKVIGLFRKAAGSFRYDESTGQLSDVKVSIDTASVYSNHEKRDEHLRSADFLNSAEFPEMTFTAAGAAPSGSGEYELGGTLTLLGVSRPVTLRATRNKVGEYPFGGGLFGGKPYVIGVSIRGSFRRSDFGMSYAVDNGWVGDEVELIIELEAQRQ